MGYELLDNDLTKSTLWMFGSKDAKILFVTLLSECHGSDVVRIPIPVIYRLAGLTLDEGAVALAELEAPDPESKFMGDGGRRVVRVEDEDGRGLSLPSYKSRRHRYLDAERKRTERSQRDDETASSRSVTPRPAASGSVQTRHATAPLKTETETETETEKKETLGRERASRFAPPSLSDVQEYGKEIPGLDAAAFFDFYASKGWKVGSAPMKDWKAAARNWRRRDVGNTQNSPRVVIHKNQSDLDREREGDEIARNRAAATREREERERDYGWTEAEVEAMKREGTL
jgi:hypothetical protein